MIEAMGDWVETGNAKRPPNNLEWQDKLLQTKKLWGQGRRAQGRRAKGT